MSDTEPDAIMTVREVCDYLKLSESTIYRLVQEGKLPGRKVGGAWRFSRKGLDEWLRERPLGKEHLSGG
ncbi:MAG TPA: helix-turn-helix domain-containing protein [Chloroflexota bacterium]|nr:helix-turn-helix domain-containing protein [Chloroflexota bacterium]